MEKIFKNVRVQRNKSLLDILGHLATAKNAVSPYTITKMLGKRKAYSGVHRNIVFLEEKGFLTTELKENGRKKRLCNITVKGALASLFSPSLTLDHSKLLERWREKDWGHSYKQPFKNIKDVSELKKLVETLYFWESSLEEVSEEIFKIGLRNPEEARELIVNASITLATEIGEKGKYQVNATIFPSTTAIGLVERLDEPNNVCFVVAPEKETGQILYEFFSHDPNYKRQFGLYLQLILQTIARDLMNRGGGGIFDHYFPHSRTFVLAVTLPEEVASLLKHPEQILKVIKNSYQQIIEPLLQSEKFVKGDEAMFTFTALKYDPKKRDLSPLSKDEIRERARKVFEQMSKVK